MFAAHMVGWRTRFMVYGNIRFAISHCWLTYYHELFEHGEKWHGVVTGISWCNFNDV